MKSRLFTMLAACFIAASTYAQIGSSVSRNIQTTVEQEQYEVSYSRKYHRLYGGLGLGIANASGKYRGESFSESSVGFGTIELGWTTGLPLMKSQDLYLETGVGFTPKLFATGGSTQFEYWGVNFEVPVNVTYRFNVGDRKFVSPYAGLFFGLACGNRVSFTDVDDERGGGNWRDVAPFPLYAGFQLGVNFDLNHFYLGLGWHYNFSNLMWDVGETNSIYNYDGEPTMRYSEIRLRIGYTFNKKKKTRIK